MTKKTLSIFEEALLDLTLLEFVGVPDEDDIEYSFSESFEKKAAELIKKSKSKAWYHVNTTAKKLLIAAIITALLATSAMAIPSVREGLIKFLTHNTGINYYFTVDEDAIKNAPKELEIIYSPSYIPAEFELTFETQSEAVALFGYTAVNSETELSIIFEQEIMPENISQTVGGLIDSERSKIEYLNLNGYKVIQISWNEPGEEAVMLLWTDESYFFSIYCEGAEMLDEAKQIFYGIQPDEARTEAYLAEKTATK